MMQRNMRTNDFEDMMRPIVRTAFDQGWRITMTANGHAKWIPPKGPPVITSVTNAAFKPNIMKLREAGLKIPEGKMEGYSNGHDRTVPTVIPEPQAQPEQAPPAEPAPPKEKRKMLPRGSVQTAVMDFMNHNPAMTVSMDDIYTAVKAKLPGVGREVVSTTCSQNAAAGRLVRMGKGLYRVAQNDRRATDATPEEQELLAGDAKVFDDFLEALAKLQDWVAKQRKMSAHFNKLKKMLEGADV